MKAPIKTTPHTAPASVNMLIADTKARVATILESPEAKGREMLAKALAFNTDMDAAAAVDILKSSPKAEESPYVQVMNTIGPSGVPTRYDSRAGTVDVPPRPDPVAGWTPERKAARLVESDANMKAFNAARAGRPPQPTR